MVVPAPCTSELKVTDPHGVLLRTLYDVARKAREFESDIGISCPGASADAKCTWEVLKLSPEKGDKVKVIAYGLDADSAVEGVSAVLVARGLKRRGRRPGSRVLSKRTTKGETP